MIQRKPSLKGEHQACPLGRLPSGRSPFAKLQCSRERPIEQPQECCPDAERLRGHGAVCGNVTEQSRRYPPVQRHAEDDGEMGRMVPCGRCLGCATALQTSFIVSSGSPPRACRVANVRLTTAAPIGSTRGNWVNTRKMWGLAIVNLATAKIHVESFVQ
jgi:hypothetical protein